MMANASDCCAFIHFGVDRVSTIHVPVRFDDTSQLLEIRRAQMLRQIAQHHDADRLVCSVDDGQSTNLALLHFGDRLLHRIVLAADEQG